MDDREIAQAINALHAESPDRDFILISHPVERALHQRLTAILDDHRRRGGKRSRCTVFLTTYGGDAHAGFRVARCLRHHYEDVRLVVGSFCKSAGTLIAIGANELAIGDLGELGPLDVQVSKPTEILERGSGLDYTQALSVALEHAMTAFGQSLLQMRGGHLRLSTKLAGELACRLACGVVEPLYAQIDPNRIGEMQRAIQIAHDYGRRLDGHGSNLHEGALDRLVAGYPSHGFVIDRKEARQLFRKVEALTAAEQATCVALWDFVKEQANICDFLYATPESNEVPEGHDVNEALDGTGDAAESGQGADAESPGAAPVAGAA